ncbi:ADGRL2 [Branchiostoma lanceolatum]|uniref:ADGRL2 protein n=1 Tax=Branchiostoma lanceolatum TaxID=7740 RepID=A0A8S4MN76_BRALA|nr:ADGRL2 [Branchiostoma lanceolatum]
MVSTFQDITVDPNDVTENSIRITWTPTSVSVDRYGVSISPVTGVTNHYARVAAADPLEYTFTGLTAGAMYTISVTTFFGGAREWQRTIPNAPQNLQLTGTTTTNIDLSWIAPSDANNATFAKYRITYSTGGTTQTKEVPDTAATSTSLTGLSPGVLYSISLVAVSADPDPTESVGAFLTVRTLPNAPQNLQLTGTTTTNIVLSWIEPSSANGATFAKYRITYSTGGTTQTKEVPDTAATSTTLTGLSPGVLYSISLVAVSADPDPTESVGAFLTVRTKQPTNNTYRYCEEEIVVTEAVQVIFPRVEGGTFSYSEEHCPSSSAIDKPLATRFCRITTDEFAVWDSPVFLSCDITLTNLSQTIEVTEENALIVATELQVITTQAETLSDDVTTTSTLMHEIVNASSTEQIGEAIMTIADNLMRVNKSVLKQSQQEDKGPTRVVLTLEALADTVELTRESLTSVRRDVALQASDISADELDKGQGFAFFMAGNKSNSLTEYRMQSFTTEEENSGFLQNADTFITLPANLSRTLQINSTADVRLSYILYNNDSLFVQTSQDAVGMTSQNAMGTRIVGSRIAGMQVKNLPEPVVITFTPKEDLLPVEVKELQCVFWDFEAKAGQGVWSTDGCMNQGVDNGRYKCACNHLTNFAALFAINGSGSGKHEKALETITIAGCIVSIVALVLTLLSFIITRNQRQHTVSVHARNQRLVLINLCVALLAILITFLAGIDQTASPIGCTVVTALLHYFLLAALIWMAVEAVNIYLAAVLVFGHYVSESFIYKAAVTAWGLPLIAMLSTVGPSGVYEYRRSDYCWLAELPLTYAFLLPAGLILMFNMVVFSIVMYKLVKGEKEQRALRGAKETKADHQWLIRQLRRAFSIMALFGLTWLFGFFVIDGDSDARTAFAYLFCIFNTLQDLASQFYLYDYTAALSAHYSQNVRASRAGLVPILRPPRRPPPQTPPVRQRNVASDKRQEGHGSSSDTYEEAERVYYTIKDEDPPPALRGAGRQQKSPQPGVQASVPPPISDKRQEGQGRSSNTHEEAERVYYTIKDEDLPPALRGAGRQQESPQPGVQTSEPPTPPVHQHGSCGRGRHGNDASDKLQEEQEAPSHTDDEAETVKRHASYTSEGSGATIAAILILLFHNTQEHNIQTPNPTQDSINWTTFSVAEPAVIATTSGTNSSNFHITDGGYTVFRGICYKVFKTKKSFDEASATCRADGGTLAMPRDAQINDFLISLYRKSGNVQPINVWFGLHDRREEGKFEWVDGSPLALVTRLQALAATDARGCNYSNYAL